MTRVKDISGQKFGSLTANNFVEVKNRMAHWNYQCVCGKTHTARANTVSYQHKKYEATSPDLPSCGCKELARKTKHGYRKANDTHPAYKAYRGMVNRCYNPNTPTYKWYGAVGVSICEEWKDKPEAFVNWAISNGWKPGLHIDKDILCKEKGIFPHVYSPETCQWITAKEIVSFATNRDNFGSHPNVKLSNEDVAELLGKYFAGGVTQTALAEEYGVTSCSISRLVNIAKGSV